MKEPNEIDKLFKDKLENLSSQEIPQSFLDDINKKLDDLDVPSKTETKPPEKKIETAKGKVGTWTLLVTLAGIFTAVYFFTKSDNVNENDNSRDDLIVDTTSSVENAAPKNNFEKEALNNEAVGKSMDKDENKGTDILTLNTDENDAANNVSNAAESHFSLNNKSEITTMLNSKEGSGVEKGLPAALKKKESTNVKETLDNLEVEPNSNKLEKVLFQTDSTTKKSTKKITASSGDSTTTTTTITTVITTTTKKVAKEKPAQDTVRTEDSNAKDSVGVEKQAEKKKPN